MACNMSSASAPRHSPTMMRSGRIRRAVCTSWRWLMPPSLFRLGGRVSNFTTWRCWSCNSAVSSMVMMRSSSGTKRDMSFSVVVLPEPVPPEMRIVVLACTHAARKRSIPCVSVLFCEHLLRRDDVPAESANRQRRPVQRQRRDDGIHARPVQQSSVDNRLRFVDAAADLRNNFFDDVQQVRIVLEPHRCQRQLARSFNVDLVEAVDQDVGDRRFLQ